MKYQGYSEFVARFPSIMMAIVFAFILTTTIVGLLTNDLPDFADPTKVQRNLDTLQASIDPTKQSIPIGI